MLDAIDDCPCSNIGESMTWVANFRVVLVDELLWEFMGRVLVYHIMTFSG